MVPGVLSNNRESYNPNNNIAEVQKLLSQERRTGHQDDCVYYKVV